MPLTPTPLDRRLAYLRLAPEELEQLARLRPAVEERAGGFVEEFYRHLLSFEETRTLLRDPVVRKRLLDAQARYVVSLVSDSIDEEYVETRFQIGLVHERIGLDPTWYLGAYSLYQAELDRVAVEQLANEPRALAQARSALSKRVLLDIQIAMESYIVKSEEGLDSLNRELAAAGRGLAREVDEQRAEALRATDRARAAEQLASIGTLAAGLAHEIGTPMGVIRGHAELLEPKVDDDKSRWRLRTIIEQIDRITNIMQALLNLARPRAPHHEEVDLAAVVELATSFLEEKLRRRNIAVETHAESLPPISGDAEKLQQLFLNLILNAIDAMPDGGRLQLRLDVSDSHHVVVDVEDDGTGISPEDLQRIFDPFVTSKESGRGSGLGLVVAHGIAVDHGGDIEVESELGRGTRFRVQLPAA